MSTDDGVMLPSDRRTYVRNEFFRPADDFGNETNEVKKKLKKNQNEMDRVKIVDGVMENGNQRLANNDIVITVVITRNAARPDFYLFSSSFLFIHE